jgi:hypothetical protein
MKEIVMEMMKELKGNIGVYYKDLTTGESFGIRADENTWPQALLSLWSYLRPSSKRVRERSALTSL